MVTEGPAEWWGQQTVLGRQVRQSSVGSSSREGEKIANTTGMKDST